MKSLVMTTGEMEYEQVFRFRDLDDDEPPGLINYIAMSHILFVIFIILMPILFANLLVSIGNQSKHNTINSCYIYSYRLVLLLATHKK